MNWLLCLTSTLLFAFSNSSDATTFLSICSNTTKVLDTDSLNLDAVGPACTSSMAAISHTCICLINTTHYLNTVSIGTLRTTGGCNCLKNLNDTATMDIMKSRKPYSMSLQGENLTNYSQNHEYVSAIRINMTIYSICGSAYTIRLTGTSYFSYKFSEISCTTTQRITTAPTAVTSTSAVTTGFNLRTASYSSTLRNATSDAGSTNKTTSTAATSSTGLIVGIVVGVGGGLLLVFAIILSLFIFRRRRARTQLGANQEMTHRNTQVENSYDNFVSSTAVSYENLIRSNDLQSATNFHKQNVATGKMASENNKNNHIEYGTDNNAFHQCDAVAGSERTASGYDNFVPEPHSNNETDITLIENDLYEK